MLTEFGLVLSLDLALLLFVGLLSRWSLGGALPGGEVRRLVNAATRAAEAFLFRAAKLTAVAMLVAVVLVVSSYGGALFRKLPTPGLPLTLWAGLAVIVGATVTLGMAYAASQIGLRSTLRAVRALQVSLDHALTRGLRAALVVALAGEAITTGCSFGLLSLLYLLHGGGAGVTPDQAVPLLQQAASALPGLAIGSVAAALVLGPAGAGYHAASRAAALSALGLEPSDARNPALVADLVGDHVGVGARRAADSVATSLLANAALVSLGVAALRQGGATAGNRGWALVSLPLVVRGVGAVASLFGVMAARTKESERATTALWRGQAACALLTAGGLAGACFWLLGPGEWPFFVAAGGSGILAGAAVVQIARRKADRRLRPVQELLDGARAGQTIALVRGTAEGLGSVALPTALVGAGFVCAHAFGEHAGIAGGGLLGTATALACLVSSGAYALTAGLFAPIASGTLTACGLEAEAGRPEARRRATLLDDAAFEGAAAAEALLIVIGSVAALVSGLSLSLTSAGDAGGPSLSLSRPVILWTGALGGALVLSWSGRAVRRAAAGARGGIVEVERQLRAFPREDGVVRVPEGHTPSYRALVELSARTATESLVVPIFVGLLVPVALGIGLRVLYTSPGLATEGLTSFVVIASATGLGAALSADGSRAVLGAAYRASRPRGSSPAHEAALSGHAFGSIAFDIAGPAAHLFARTVAAVALLVAPLLG